MTDVLRIKRRASGAVGAPTALANAELAFNEVDHTLYYGSGDSGGNATNIIPVAGPGAFLPLAGGTEAGHVTFQNGIDFNNAVASGPQDTSQGITLWSQGVGSSYGFAVTSNTLNYNTVAGWHDFYSSSQLLMRVGNGALTSWLPLSVQNTATINGTLNVAGATVMQSPLWVTAVPSVTQAQLYIQPPGGTLALESKMRFHGTFHDGTTDVGVRFVASLRSGFAAGAWSGEYLDIWTNNQPNDANSDANQSRIIRFTLANIALGAGVGLTLDHDPIANLGAATKQYVDNHAPLGGPYLPLSGGAVTGYTTFAPSMAVNYGGTNMTLAPGLGSGSYNGIVQSGDALLLAHTGAPDTGAITLAPWSNTLLGIRIDGVAKTIALTSTGPITVNTDPTTALGVATKQYVDNHAPLGGPYLPLVGGTLSGGLHFGSTTVGGASDLSRHISLYEGYCGLSVTGGRMNLYSQGSSVFVDSANSDIAYFDASGLTMGGGFGINAGSVSASGTLTVQGASLFNNDVSVNSVNLWVGSSAAVQPHLTVQSATNQGAGIRLYAGNYQRWLLALDAYPESTDNTNQGGNLAFYAFADTGAFINTMLSINRADGYIYLSSTIQLGRDPTAALEAATKQYVDNHQPLGGPYLPLSGGVLSGGLTINAFVRSWSSSNIGQQLIIEGVQNNALGISDSGGVNYIAVVNSGGSFLFAKMPALTDNTTGPTGLLQLAAATATFYTPVALPGNATTALQAVPLQQLNSVAGNYLPLSGGTLSGPLTVNSTLSVSNNATFNGGVYFQGAGLGYQSGMIYTDANFGCLIRGRAGAIYDVALADNGGTWWVGLASGGLLTVIGAAQFQSTVALAADPTTALQAATKQYVDNHAPLGGPYLPLSGGTISGSLTVQGTTTLNGPVSVFNALSTSGPITSGGILYVAANIAAPPPPGGSAAIGWNYTQGSGEVDFFNTYNSGGLSFAFYQVTGSGTTKELADLDASGNLRMAGVGVRYGMSGGGNLMGFAWSGSVEAWVDGSHVGTLATQTWVNGSLGSYLPLAGGHVTGDVTFSGPNPSVIIDGPNATWRTIEFHTSGVPRWNFQASADSETGGDAGSDFHITRASDSGAYVQVVNISRATGLVTLSQGLSVGGAVQLTNNVGISYDNNNYFKFQWTGSVSDLYVDNSNQGAIALQNWVAGNYLALSGGSLSGGLHFGGAVAPGGPTDTSRHITLYDNGYGFSITGGTLNIVAGGALDYYPNGGLVMRMNGGGLQMLAGAVTLLADPTGPLQATTKQYVDALVSEPVNVKWPAYGARGNGSTDDTTAIQNALNTGLDIYLPGGTYIISQQLNMTTFGQRVLGAGRSRTFIKVNGPSAANFPTAIIYVNNAAMTGGADFNVTFADFTMWCVQPDTSVRANLNSYPPMIYLDHACRSQMKDVRLVGGLDGLYMNGNNGGFRASGCDFGCFSINIFVDGNLDVTSFTDCQVWCFSATSIMTANQQKIFWDANCYGIYSKRNDYLDWKGGLFMVGRAAQFDMGTRSDWPGPTYGHFTGTGFDSFGGLGVSAGNILTDNCTFSVGGDPSGIRSNSALVHTGGVVTIRGGKFFVGAVNLIPNQSLIWTGCGSGVASLIIEACEFEMGAADVRAIYAETSNNAYDSIQIANNKFTRLAGYSYTTAAVQINGGGGTLTGNVCGPGAGAMTGTVPALGMAAGIGTWLTANNNWHGWTTGVTGSTVTAQNLLQLPPVVGDAMAIVQVNGNATIGGMSILGEVGANPAFAGIFVTLLFAGTCTVNAGGYAIAGQFLLNNGTAFNTRPGSHLSVRLSTSGNWVEIGRCY